MHVLVLKYMKTAINHSTVGNAQYLDTLGPWSGIKLLHFLSIEKVFELPNKKLCSNLIPNHVPKVPKSSAWLAVVNGCLDQHR